MSRREAWRAWWRAETGSVAVETALVAPLLILLLVFVAVVIHRGVDARIRVNDVAHQAARAATLHRDPITAHAAAQAAAEQALAEAGVSCAPLTVDADVGSLAPGSTVRVRITCRADLGQAAIPGLADDRLVTGEAREVVDFWRGTQPPRVEP